MATRSFRFFLDGLFTLPTFFAARPRCLSCVLSFSVHALDLVFAAREELFSPAFFFFSLPRFFLGISFVSYPAARWPLLFFPPSRREFVAAAACPLPNFLFFCSS